MKINAHLEIARSIDRSLGRLDSSDFELVVEGAMLAGTHYFNALLLEKNVMSGKEHVIHAEFMNAAQVARLDDDCQAAWLALITIEGMRTWYVRGDDTPDEPAFRRLQNCLGLMRDVTRHIRTTPPHTQDTTPAGINHAQ